jgi:hypothetical protein
MLMLTPGFLAATPDTSPRRATVRVVRERPVASSHPDKACPVQRMVISGRISEVCAALERMTAHALA